MRYMYRGETTTILVLVPGEPPQVWLQNAVLCHLSEIFQGEPLMYLFGIIDFQKIITTEPNEIGVGLPHHVYHPRGTTPGIVGGPLLYFLEVTDQE